MNIEASDRTAEIILAQITEGIRLRKMSDLELIRECMKDDLTDDMRVLELIERVKPNWLDEI